LRTFEGLKMQMFKIKSALSSLNKQLSAAQRSSSLFSEAPVIAGKILRRGAEIVLTEAQYLSQKAKIEMSLKAGAITVEVLGDGGKLSVDVNTDPKAELTLPVVDVKTTAPEAGVVAPEVKGMVVEATKEVVSDVIEAVKAEVALEQPVVAPEVKPEEGVKKGKRWKP